MPDSNTIDRTINVSVINWDTFESKEYKLVLVGIEEVEKSLLKRFHYRNVPDFKKLPNKSTRYCVLVLENKFISGKYEGEITYFESDAYSFRKVNLENSRVDFFRESRMCSGTIDCKFDECCIDEKFVLPSNVINGVYEYQEINREKIDERVDAIFSEESQRNKCEHLDNIVKMHVFAESIFYGRTEKYLSSCKRFCIKNDSERVLSMNKILGTAFFERDIKYWSNILPKYFFGSSKNLKDVHLKDYQNAIICNVSLAFTLMVSSFFEFYYDKFNIGTTSFISGSLIYMDVIFRSALSAIYTKAKNTVQNKPGIIGTAIDFAKFWKDVFWQKPTKKP